MNPKIVGRFKLFKQFVIKSNFKISAERNVQGYDKQHNTRNRMWSGESEVIGGKEFIQYETEIISNISKLDWRPTKIKKEAKMCCYVEIISNFKWWEIYIVPLKEVTPTYIYKYIYYI